MQQYTEHIAIATTLSNVPASQWNALAGSNPTISYDYLYGLEASGCATKKTGWSPHHILLYRDNTLAGALPLYLKSHSRGEYVFDYAWAHAFEHHGLSYYPKLVSAIPFTPVPGPRLLAHTQADKQRLLDVAIGLAHANQVSSLHILFPHDTDHHILSRAGLLTRRTVQFHWFNHDYKTTDDFLTQLNQRNRKKTRQNRRRLRDEGIQFEWKEGAGIDAATLDFFYRCYHKTYLEHGNLPYLNHSFFAHLIETMAPSIVIIIARQNNEPIAASLCLRDGKRLYGRYWGCLRFVSGLHFETCYLQGIEYSISRGIHVFEGGAQGEHKLARGMLPVQTYSAHWIRDSRFAHAIQNYLEREDTAMDHYINELEDHSPFRQAPMS